jgi:Fis family transcriptional regulator, factor for inversion stimulation protein
MNLKTGFAPKRNLSHGSQGGRVAYFDAQEAEALKPQHRGLCHIRSPTQRSWPDEPHMRQTSYPTSAELDALVLQMYRAGISYAEGVREFRKQFVLTALRDTNWNESKAAPVLRMHRNTLRRTLQNLNIDIGGLRKTERRPTRSIDLRKQKNLAS